MAGGDRVGMTPRWALRGGLLALVALGVLSSAAPALADGVDGAEVVESEVTASELISLDPVTLALRPLCSNGDLRRFAVDHVEGPATRFTVRVAGAQDRSLPIRPGATRRFWVRAAPQDEVTIDWADRTETAKPIEDPCSGNRPVSGEPPPAPRATAAPEPEASADPGRPSRRRTSSQRGDTAPTELPASAAARGDPDARSPAVDAPAGAPQRDGPDDTETPRPQPSGDGVACPEGWIAVDDDGDGHVGESDGCEVVIETASDARPVGANLTVVALAVTVTLLLASIGFGALSRRQT